MGRINLNEDIVAKINEIYQRSLDDLIELACLEEKDRSMIADLIKLLSVTMYDDYEGLKSVYIALTNVIPPLTLKYEDHSIEEQLILSTMDSSIRQNAFATIKENGQRVSADLVVSEMLGDEEYRVQYYKVKSYKAVIRFFEALKFSVDGNRKILGMQ